MELARTFNDNLTELRIGTALTVWFSYETPIAYAVDGHGTFKLAKGPTQTTDRHLASIPAKGELTQVELDAALAALTSILVDSVSDLVFE